MWSYVFFGCMAHGLCTFFSHPKAETERTGENGLQKESLIKSAARLYSLGVDLEGARERVRKLVEGGVGYNAPEMAKAVREYTEIKELWDNLEKEHLALRSEIAEDS